jgi:hypothetical protein
MEKPYQRYGVTKTRLGLLLDHLIDVSKKQPSLFDRQQFIKITRLGNTSTADKLKDMVTFGLISKQDRSNYIINPLMHAIVKGGSERTSAIKTAIKKISLWDQLLNKAIDAKTDKNSFKSAIKSITNVGDKQIAEDIDWLWYAYTEDISCIDKTPPFSIYSEIFGKAEITQRSSDVQNNRNLQENEMDTSIPRGLQDHQIIEPTAKIILEQPAEHPKKEQTAEKHPQLILHKPRSKYGFIEYQEHRFEIKDELSYGFAEQIMRKIKKDLEEQGVKLEL